MSHSSHSHDASNHAHVHDTVYSHSGMIDVDVEPSTAVAAESSSHMTPTTAFLWHEAPNTATIQQAHGPTVLSNWIIPSLLCVGGYPSASESTKAHLYAEAMANERFDVYVNLMGMNELKRFRPYADLVTYKGSLLHPPHPQPEFIHFPIVDGGTPKEEAPVIALIYELIQRMKKGKRIYVHCWGGHGRTGMIVSIILSVISSPPRSVDESLQICQSLHGAREYNGGHKSPEPSQVPFVRRVVESILRLPENYAPPTDHLQHLSFTLYEPPADMEMEDSNSSSAIVDVRAKARDRRARRERAQQDEPSRAGGGEGVIVVDSHGTASTTQAMSSVPSTPLMSPARRVSREIPPMEEQQLLTRTMLPITDDGGGGFMDETERPPPFTILQFNALADSLCNAKSFPHAVAAALDWQVRKQLLLDEMVSTHGSASSSPDIVCLQECDHFSDWFQPQLAAHGYTQSVFFKKYSVHSFDGVAAFVKDSKFTLLEHESVQLEGMNQVLILLQLMPHDTNGLRLTNDRRRLYVATTHLKAKEGFELVRLKQVQLITHHLQSFISKHHHAVSSNPPHSSLGFFMPPDAGVLFVGDFNDIPHSLMYNYLVSGSSEVDTSHVTKKTHDSHEEVSSIKMMDTSSSVAHEPGYLTPRKGATPSSASASSNHIQSIPPPPIRHSLWFRSLYNRFYDPLDNANHPGQLYTTIKHRDVLVQRCIDYIFFSPQHLRPVGILSIPNVHTQLTSYLPAINYGSDHLAIAGRFEWK